MCHKGACDTLDPGRNQIRFPMALMKGWAALREGARAVTCGDSPRAGATGEGVSRLGAELLTGELAPLKFSQGEAGRV